MPFPARSPMCGLFTVGEVGFWSFGTCVCCRDPCDCLECSVAIPATVFPLVLVWFGRIGFQKGFWSVMWSAGFQTQEEFLGVGTRSGPKEFWQRQSQSMAGRSGRANSVKNRMCGRGGVAVSRRGCTGSLGRRSLQSQESGLQALRHRAGKIR